MLTAIYSRTCKAFLQHSNVTVRYNASSGVCGAICGQLNEVGLAAALAFTATTLQRLLASWGSAL